MIGGLFDGELNDGPGDGTEKEAKQNASLVPLMVPAVVINNVNVSKAT